MRKKRAKVLQGKTIKFETPCGSLFLTLNNDSDGSLIETRCVLGKSGTCVRGWMEAFMILLSIFLQLEIPADEKIKLFKRHLLEIHCGNAFSYDGENYTSCMDLISKFCIRELEDEKRKEEKETKQ